MISSMQVSIKPPASLGMLLVMNAMGYPMYQGTVPAKVIRQRRARNKRARISRRLNRRGQG